MAVGPHLLLRYDSTNLAFRIFDPENYQGGTDWKFEQIGRAATNGSLVVVKLSTTKRDFQGVIQADEFGGSVDYNSVTYDFGTLDELKAALADDGLEAASGEDISVGGVPSFWEAHYVPQFTPQLFRPYGDIVRVHVRLIEK